MSTPREARSPTPLPAPHRNAVKRLRLTILRMTMVLIMMSIMRIMIICNHVNNCTEVSNL